jgi:hypothetical protein
MLYLLLKRLKGNQSLSVILKEKEEEEEEEEGKIKEKGIL